MKVGLTHLGVVAYIIASSALVFAFPQSVLAFLCFEASSWSFIMRRSIKRRSFVWAR